MAGERSEFIQRQSAALQVAAVASEVGGGKGITLDRAYEIIKASLQLATYLADALNLTDSPAPAGGETYEIQVEVCDAWMSQWGDDPPHPNLRGSTMMFDAIAAARGAATLSARKPGGEA